MKRTWAISRCENSRPYVSPHFILLIVSLRSFIRHMGGSVPQVIDVMSSISCYGVGSLVGLLTQNKLFASFCPDVPTRCTQSITVTSGNSAHKSTKITLVEFQ